MDRINFGSNNSFKNCTFNFYVQYQYLKDLIGIPFDSIQNQPSIISYSIDQLKTINKINFGQNNTFQNCTFNFHSKNQKFQKDMIWMPFDYISNKSKIISINQVNTLKDFFLPKKLKSIKLLYRASQNNFQIEKFHQNCDNIHDTLVVIKNEYNKIIGGYTPLVWKSTKDQTSFTDESNQSFLFSLTTKDKFTHNHKLSTTSIQCLQKFGPIFGGGTDLCISDKSNKNDHSHSSIGCSYKNPNYQQGQQLARQKFCGTPSTTLCFKIFQWEVFQLQFNK